MKKLILTLLALLALPATGDTLHVAAASDLTYSIPELADAFRKQSPGVEVRTSLGSSGNFFAQIKNGAPFDVFLSADMLYPKRLADDGAADGTTLTAYAIGRLAIWSLDPRLDLKQGMAVFRDPRVTRVAIANPDVAPYGMAARAALQHHGVWDVVLPKLVKGENVAQTAQFIQTGNAQLGVISYATVLAPRLKGIGSYYLVPAAGLAPIEQGAIITAKGKSNPQAVRFMQFMQSPVARAILQRHGFTLPPAKDA